MNLVTISTAAQDTSAYLMLFGVVAAVFSGAMFVAAMVAPNRRWTAVAWIASAGLLSTATVLFIVGSTTTGDRSTAVREAFAAQIGATVDAPLGFDYKFTRPQTVPVTVDGRMLVCAVKKADERAGEIDVAVACAPTRALVGK